ncbi:ADP ribosylation factor like GTPase 16 [Rhinolophus ferrumequinum]|uniref:ADP ribosylation factor like GTPase 16 n=1 Tax=Rhinolophus ferrumequinum TaxID=59479 RepID=A0A7J7TKZ6_RHIFE|nr:ADP ribosylation factor like GTPase 16 [Rhinolophus ferrumequinum]
MTLLVKWLQKLSSQYGKGDLGNPPPTWSMVGTNLTDIVAHRKITTRELNHLQKHQSLIIFNENDLRCDMTIEEMKSLIRLPNIIACTKQNITMAETSAGKGNGLPGAQCWLQDTHRTTAAPTAVDYQVKNVPGQLYGRRQRMALLGLWWFVLIKTW